jgi:hypothetical protein
MSQEYEQRLQEHEAAIAEAELPAPGEAVEYTSGICEFEPCNDV